MKKRVKHKTEIKKEKNNPKITNYKFILWIAGIILLVLVILLISKNFNPTTGNFISINPSTGEADILGLNPDNIPKDPEELKELIRKNYLKREWGEEFRNKDTFIGKYTWRIFAAYDKISPYTDPIFRYTIGVVPGMNWLFILTFTIWITFTIYSYRIFSAYSTFSRGVSFVMSLCINTIMANMLIHKWIAEKIIGLFSLLSTWWMQLIAILLGITLLIVFSLFSKEWTAFFKRMKENREKMKKELKMKEVEMKADSANETVKNLAKAFDKV